MAPEALVLDFLEWVAERPRPYREVIDAWRTSCPRLTVWEEAIERGLVERGARMGLTAAGTALLALSGRRPVKPATAAA